MSFTYEWFRFERLMVAARCLGAAERLVAEMTALAKDRVVQGQPIMAFGAVQAMLADSLTELFAAPSLIYQTARGIDAGIDVKVQHAQCSMAKLYAVEMAIRVADRAVQVFGGRGYMREYATGRFYRELGAGSQGWTSELRARMEVTSAESPAAADSLHARPCKLAGARKSVKASRPAAL